MVDHQSVLLKTIIDPPVEVNPTLTNHITPSQQPRDTPCYTHLRCLGLDSWQVRGKGSSDSLGAAMIGYEHWLFTNGGSVCIGYGCGKPLALMFGYNTFGYSQLSTIWP